MTRNHGRKCSLRRRLRFTSIAWQKTSFGRPLFGGPDDFSMLRPPVTVPISAVHGLLSGARAQGVVTAAWIDAVLEAAGIAGERLTESGSRVTAEQYVALFSAVMDSLDDECLGQLSRPLRRGSFALIARSTLGSSSVEVALRRAAKSLNLLQDDVVVACMRDGPLSGITLEINSAATACENFLHELLLRVFWRLLVWLHGDGLVPRRFDFSFGQPPYAADYARIFSAPLRFGQPRSAVWFDGDALAGPVRRDADAMQAFLNAAPGNLVGPRLVERDVSSKVRSTLQRASPDWPDLAATAGRLHMSVSALQRHLAAEATSFQTVKDQLRRDLAIVRLNTSQVPLATLAADLGFADSAAFQRAFKTWTGNAPGSYRARALHCGTRSTACAKVGL